MINDCFSFSSLRDKLPLSEEEDILRLRRTENFHRLGRIREALSFVVSSNNSTENPSNSYLTNASFQRSTSNPETHFAVGACSTNGTSSPVVFDEEGNSSIPAPSSSKHALGIHRILDSNCSKKLQETEKKSGLLQRSKYTLSHYCKESSCSLPFTEKKDVQEGVTKSQKKLGLSSLQKVALAAWKLFVARNNRKSPSCCVVTLVDDCNDEMILKTIEEGGETIDYFIHALEEWRSRIPHLSDREEETGMYEESKIGELRSDFMLGKKNEGEAHDFFSNDNLVKLLQKMKNMTDLLNGNRQDWVKREESLTRTIIYLEDELEFLHAENQMRNTSPIVLSLQATDCIPSHSGKKRHEGETLGHQDQLEATQQQCNDYAVELNKVRKEFEASEKKCAKYVQEIENLKASLDMSEKLLQELRVQPSNLTHHSKEGEKNTENSFKETFELETTLQEEKNVLKVWAQNGHDHFSVHLMKGSFLTCSVVNQLNQGLPKGITAPYLSCSTTENSGKVTIENLLDDPQKMSLNYLQETVVNFFHDYSSATEVSEERESNSNSNPFTVRCNDEEIDKDAGAKLTSISPALAILDSYLKSASLDCQNSGNEESTDSTGAAEDDFSLSGHEFLLVSKALRSKYQNQCSGTGKVPMLHFEMLACDVLFSAKVLYQVGGGIAVALGVMTTSSQQQWCRLLSSAQHFLDFFAEKLVGKEGVQTFVQLATNSVLMSYSLFAPLCQKQDVADDANLLVLALAIILSPIYSLSWNATHGTLLCDPLLEEYIWRIICMIIKDSEIYHMMSDSAVQQYPIYLISQRKQTTLLEELHEVLSNDWHQGVLVPLALFSFSTNRGCAKLSDDFTSCDEGLDDGTSIPTVTSPSTSHPLFSHTRYLPACSFLSILPFFSQLSMILDVIRCQLQLLQTPLVSNHNYENELELINNALIIFDSFILPSFCLLSRLPHVKKNDAVALLPLQHHFMAKEVIENYLSSVVTFFLEKRSYFWKCWIACQDSSESSSKDTESNTVKVLTLQSRTQNVFESSRRIKFIPQCRVEEWCRRASLSKNNPEIQNESPSLRSVSGDNRIERLSEVEMGMDSSSVMLERILPELLHLYKENESYRSCIEELLSALSE